jgi:hypothetical protein
MAKVSRVLAVGVVGVLAVMGSGVAQDKVLMRLNLEKGQVFTYEMTTTSELVNQSQNFTGFEAVYNLTVKMKLGNGYELEESLSSASQVGEPLIVPSLNLDPSLFKVDNMGTVQEVKPELEQGSWSLSLLGGRFPSEAIEVGSTWTSPIKWPKEYRISPTIVRYSVFERKTYKSWEVFEIQGQYESQKNEFQLSTLELVDIKSGMPVLTTSVLLLKIPEIGDVRVTSTTRLLRVK